MFKGLVDDEKVKSSKSLLEFETHFVSKLVGYSNVEDYYREGSCRYVLDDIKVPMLCLNSLDDNIVDPNVCKSENPNIIIGMTTRGGHQCYSEGLLPWKSTNWAVPIGEEFFSILQNMKDE
jgi:uncharacterized protein